MFLASNFKNCRAITWLLVISSLACWEIAATRFQGCALGSPDLRACQSIDLYAPDYAVSAHKNKTDHYQSAQLLAFTSHPLIIGSSRSAYEESVRMVKWQPHYDAPPTPPPDRTDSTFFA